MARAINGARADNRVTDGALVRERAQQRIVRRAYSGRTVASRLVLF